MRDQRHKDSREKVMLFPTTLRFFINILVYWAYFDLIINMNLFVQHDKKGCDSTWGF